MKRVYRSEKDKIVAGIFGALGEMYSVDPTLLRLIFVFVAIITGVIPFFITYVIAWIIIPVKEAKESD